MEELADELVVMILGYLHDSVEDWYSVLSTCKRLNRIGYELFEPLKYSQDIYLKLVRLAKLDSLRKLLSVHSNCISSYDCSYILIEAVKHKNENILKLLRSFEHLMINGIEYSFGCTYASPTNDFIGPWMEYLSTDIRQKILDRSRQLETKKRKAIDEPESE